MYVLVNFEPRTSPVKDLLDNSRSVGFIEQLMVERRVGTISLIRGLELRKEAFACTCGDDPVITRLQDQA